MTGMIKGSLTWQTATVCDRVCYDLYNQGGSDLANSNYVIECVMTWIIKGALTWQTATVCDRVCYDWDNQGGAVTWQTANIW